MVAVDRVGIATGIAGRAAADQAAIGIATVAPVAVDLPAVAARSHEVGARLVIDGSQSVGVMPLDVAALRPDFVVTVGYK